jgi:hypothetical protein
MSADPRATQFAGFAKLLLEEALKAGFIFNIGTIYIDTGNVYWQQNMEEVIAQRAYDLVGHTLDQINPHVYLMEDIPDLTEWPEEDA